MDNIAIIRLSSMGDIILTEPVTRVLKDNFPDSQIFYFTRRIYKTIIGMFPTSVSVIPLQMSDENQSLREIKKMVQGMNPHFDLVIDLHKNIRSHVIMKNINAEKKATYDKFRWQRQKAVWFKIKNNSISTTAKYLLPLTKMNMKIHATEPRLIVSDFSLKEASKYMQANSLQGKEFAVLAAGASHIPKKLMLNKWAEIAEMLYQKFGLKSLVVDDQPIALDEFEPLIKAGIIIADSNIVIQILSGILNFAKLTISNDSGVMHLSAGIGTPTLGLFGPTHPVLGFAPVGDHCQALTTDESCSPCSLHGKRECYKKEQYCFTNMSTGLIENSIKEILR